MSQLQDQLKKPSALASQNTAPVAPNFPLRIEPELRAELDAYALREQRSLNTLINRFIRNGLKKARS